MFYINLIVLYHMSLFIATTFHKILCKIGKILYNVKNEKVGFLWTFNAYLPNKRRRHNGRLYWPKQGFTPRTNRK